MRLRFGRWSSRGVWEVGGWEWRMDQWEGDEEEHSSQMGKHFVFCGFGGQERG